jgi:hypothetical protein
MTGPELATFCEEINGGASIGDTLLFQFINIARAMTEQRRPWMILRKTDTSKSVTTASTWQTAISLATITTFSRFYGERPVKIFDGLQTSFEYRQVPFSDRLSYIVAPDTFVYDEGNTNLYLNGTPPFAGTLYIDYVKDSGDITNDDNSSWVFPSWSHALLGFMAVGIYKGGVDFDDVNARMSPENRAQAEQIVKMLESWDNEKQLSAQSQTDPYSPYSDGYRPNAINLGS